MRALAALALLAALGCAGCAATGGPAGESTLMPPRPDSATTILWRFDDGGGLQVFDSGPLRIRGTAGLDTRTDFGLFRNARLFQRSMESFVHAPYEPVMNERRISVEAWIRQSVRGEHELTPIAARWTERASEQSWLFGVVGRRLLMGAQYSSPHQLDHLVTGGIPGHLVFAFQTEQAGLPNTYFSTADVPLDRWVHVAVTFDGEVVAFWLDGRLDSQHAVRGALRQTPAPLVVGNYFDPLWLSGFSGDLRVGDKATHGPVYAFEGLIDELRISNGARAGFELR